MTMHLMRELEKLKKLIITLSTLVEENYKRAYDSVANLDIDMAKETIERDNTIDDLEIEVEEECLKILALHQPVAMDLRFIVAILKFNSIMERIGDISVNIAKRVFLIKNHGATHVPPQVMEMADMVQNMLKDSIDAVLNLDSNKASRVRSTDAGVDNLNQQVYDEAKAIILEDSEQFNIFFHWINVAKNLERIGDHAANIAEEVFYMDKGVIVRHKK